MPHDLVVSGLSTSIDGRPVLDGIEHRFAAGTVTLLLGQSGSGKTMLLETLAGLRQPHSGEIRIGDSPVWTGRKPDRQSMLKLGTAFQHPEQQLFAQSIKQEFTYTLKPYRIDDKKRDHVTKQALALAMGDADGWLERDPFTLSGGQRRRLTMALLHAADPEWLLLDEPLAGLDHEAIAHLRNQLRQRKQDNKSAVVVTHDPEALLEIADRVVVLREGRMLWSGTPAELADEPGLFERAGLALPGRLHTLEALRKAGFAMPSGWLEPSETASVIAKQLSCEVTELKIPSISTGETLDNRILRSPGTHTKKNAPLDRFDPRAIWLAYMLLTPGILLQTSWIGWLASGVLTTAVIRFAEVPFRVWSRPAFGLALFTIIASIAAGLTIGDNVTFSAAPAVGMLFQFSKLVMIMLVGYVLLSGIPPLRLKRALEQGLHAFKRLRVPIDQFAMTAALMVRFIPVLMSEWNRFSRIAAARGKYPVRPGRIPIRRMKATVVPFLMALLRLGETLSIILIVRGVGRTDQQPTQAYRLKFHFCDIGMIATALTTLSLLILIQMLNE